MTQEHSPLTWLFAHRLPADVAAVGVGVAALGAQSLLLPHPGPWPVKLLGSLNLLALVAAIACWRRGWWGALRGVAAAVAVLTAVVIAIVTANG